MLILEWYWVLALMLGVVVGLLIVGLPVAFAFFAANILGAFIFNPGETGIMAVPDEFSLAIAKFTLVPVALFILMGEILFHTGVAFQAITAIDRLIVRVPGRMSVVSIAGGTVFSSLSGSTIANTAILGSVLLPDMLKRGYAPNIAMGPIMAVGGIAMLIPPSALAVLLASLSEDFISIQGLLIAGIVPGVLMAMLFFLYVVTRCWLNPSLAPVDPQEEQMPLRERWMPFIRDVMPLFLIFVVVVGSIFGRIAAPEEAAALGAIASAIACIAYRKLTWANFLKALRETAKVNTMILFIVAGSLTFSQTLQISGGVTGLLGEISAWQLSVTEAMIIMMLILLFLGAFMDQVSMILLTLPFFQALAISLGIEPLWLGVLILIAMEVSLLTPPFGLLLYVMKGVAPGNIRMMQVYASAMPFILIEIAVMALLVALPVVALWLPGLLR